MNRMRHVTYKLGKEAVKYVGHYRLVRYALMPEESLR